MAESEEALKSLLMKLKEGSGLKFNIKKNKIIASGPTISWQIDKEKIEIVKDFIFFGSKITVDGDCSHEIKTLALRRKVMTNLDSDITLLAKVHIFKALVFPVFMYGYESWTIKKAGH